MKADYETLWESEIHIEENNLPCVIVEKDNTYKGKNKYMVYEYDNGTHHCYSGEESKEKAIDVPLSIAEPVLGGSVDPSLTKSKTKKI